MYALVLWRWFLLLEAVSAGCVCFEDAGSVDVAGKINRLQRVLVLIQTFFGVSGPASIVSLFINMPLLQISGAENAAGKLLVA